MESAFLINQIVQTSGWQHTDQIVDAVQKIGATLAILAAGTWSYFRFIRFRTLKPRLEFSFDWKESFSSPCARVGILTAKLSNRGTTKVDLREQGAGACLLKYQLVQAKENAAHQVTIIGRSRDYLEHLGGIFEAHKWIEPGETIDDVRVIQIRDVNSVAIQFEIRIYGTKKWTATAAFLLAGSPQHGKSEDEQDDYEEQEKIAEFLRSRIAEGRLLISGGQCNSNREALAFILEKAECVVAQFSNKLPHEILKNAKGVLDNLTTTLSQCKREGK